MAKRKDKGIDYGLGQTNIDKETGIRNGIIPLGEINQDCIDEFELDYGEPHCPKCGNDVTSEIPEDLDDFEDNGRDYVCLECKYTFESDEAFPEEANGSFVDNDEYQLILDSYNDIWVLKSKYFTRAAFCSPCAPGACYLTNDTEQGEKAYCLGHDWFEGNKAPYPVYSVDTGNEIIVKEVKVTCPNCRGTTRDTVARIAAIRGAGIEETRVSLESNQPYLNFQSDNTFDCWRCFNYETKKATGFLIEHEEEEEEVK